MNEIKNLRELETRIYKHDYNEGNQKEFDNICYEISAAITALETKLDTNRWISVTEDLPKLNVPVLILTVDKEIYTAKLKAKNHGIWYIENGPGSFLTVDLTHWHYLPELPNRD